MGKSSVCSEGTTRAAVRIRHQTVLSKAKGRITKCTHELASRASPCRVSLRPRNQERPIQLVPLGMSGRDGRDGGAPARGSGRRLAGNRAPAQHELDTECFVVRQRWVLGPKATPGFFMLKFIFLLYFL
jgi:hypothetical protein